MLGGSKQSSGSKPSFSAALSRRRVEAERAAIKTREQNNLARQQEALQRQREFTEKTMQWNEQILPRWDILSRSPRVKDLCARGIPPNIRGKVWPLLIGNDLGIDAELFEALSRKVLLCHSTRAAAAGAAGAVGAAGVGPVSGTKKKSGSRSRSRSTSPMPLPVTVGGSPGKGGARKAQALQEAPTGGAEGARAGGVVVGAAKGSSGTGLGISNSNRSADGDGPATGAGEQHDDAMGRDEEAGDCSNEDVPESSEEEEEADDIDELLLCGKDVSREPIFAPSTSVDSDRSSRLDSGDNPSRDQQLLMERRSNAEVYQLEAATMGVNIFSSRVDLHYQQRSQRQLSRDIAIPSDQRTRHRSRSGGCGTSKGAATGIAGDKGTRAVHALGSPSSEGSVDNKDGIAASFDEDADEFLALEERLQRESRATPSEQQRQDDGAAAAAAAAAGANGANDSGRLGTPSSLTSGLCGAAPGDKLTPNTAAEANTKRPSVSALTLAVSSSQSSLTALLQNAQGASTSTCITAPGAADEGGDAVDCTKDPSSPGCGAACALSVSLSPSGRGSSSPTLVDAQSTAPTTTGTTASSSTHTSSSHAAAGAAAVSAGSAPPIVSCFSTADSAPNSVGNTPARPRRGRRVPESPDETQLGLDLDMDLASGVSEPPQNGLQSKDDNHYNNHDRGDDKSSAPSTPRAAAVSQSQSRQVPLTPSSTQDGRLLNAMNLIEWDLPRTFPTLGFFHDGGPMHIGLERVLLCFACYSPEIGYVQGMSFLVAMLLLYMDEFEAFKCLANLLGRKINLDFYRLKKESIDAYVSCFDYFFKKTLPLLHTHMHSEGVTSEMFLMDWNLALFTKALPLEIAAQVWDSYLFEGEIYIMCVALGILKMYAPKLSKLSVEKISPFLLHLPENLKADELFFNVSLIHITPKQYEKVRGRFTTESHARQNSVSDTPAAGGGAATPSVKTKGRTLTAAIRLFSPNSGSSSANTPSGPQQQQLAQAQHIRQNTAPPATPTVSVQASSSTSSSSGGLGSSPPPTAVTAREGRVNSPPANERQEGFAATDVANGRGGAKRSSLKGKKPDCLTS